MRIERNDIWDCLRRNYHVTIPVNCGWTRDYRNVMGRGLARDAKIRYPGCDLWLGKEHRFIASMGKPMGDPAWLLVYPHAPLVFFPTKPLRTGSPWLSWSGKSDKEMIGRLLVHFPAFADRHKIERIAVPLLGAGNGGLDMIEMRDFIRGEIGDDPRFLLVTPSYV